MKNGKKQYAVLGLGGFGISVALALQKAGCDVIAVDHRMEQVKEISDSVSYAMKANIEDEEMIRSLEPQSLDGVIVATSDNLEASIMATLLVKEQGAPYVLAKAKSKLHAEVLKKVGADDVILVEYEMGQWVAQNLIRGTTDDMLRYEVEEQKDD